MNFENLSLSLSLVIFRGIEFEFEFGNLKSYRFFLLYHLGHFEAVFGHLLVLELHQLGHGLGLQTATVGTEFLPDSENTRSTSAVAAGGLR